ncbi:bifunctional GNAT family N-acetyltransferase/ATP-binding protein [Kitasatospora sp. NBC_01287]|uniref:ATP-binding protein n=1 Tax=Kitasatospora sp. NBC_01287 TaxID=2903573 RepID=UPI00225982EB|nr:bifunctional GNAT family N-acetyltransferase/ATP-binding protein [Kitasatospora sp. NBC_01287]MCX4744059.1 bifunctional GNAT family N-acetyltransferase/ATP-binding protein [Kitasatospora sp. NBC_01287]
MNWLIHDYREDDLADVVHLIDSTAGLGQESVFSLAECISALTAHPQAPGASGVGAEAGGGGGTGGSGGGPRPAVVAVRGGATIGAALACTAGERAWVMRIAIAPAWRGRGLASALLRELERRLVALRIRRIAYVLPEEELLGEGLSNAGYTRHPAAAYFEKAEPAAGTAVDLLEELGGRLLPGDLWERVAGMEAEKDLIERRIVRPLAEPELAARHGVRPPRAIALFGPPGTGKTTFARAIASRLGWPFVELLPSRLADQGNPAAALRTAFARIGELERVLVFIDEVEEIAPARGLGAGQADGRGRSEAAAAAHGVTNELLKIIPGFRERDERLLVCATNSVRSLDQAFLRHGRFDYLVPIGTPDAAARAAIWRRHAADRPTVDLDALVAASASFTPADIEHAARGAAQAAFERDLARPVPGPPESAGASTEDYLAATARCRPTVTPAMIEEFTADIATHARI